VKLRRVQQCSKWQRHCESLLECAPGQNALGQLVAAHLQSVSCVTSIGQTQKKIETARSIFLVQSTFPEQH
jgi:hypothetical protein